MDEMPNRELQMWEKLMSRAGLMRHPKLLTPRGRELQYLLLARISDDPYRLPGCARLEQWWEWHEKHGTVKRVKAAIAEWEPRP